MLEITVPNVSCPACLQSVELPVAPAQAHCANCGQELAFVETRVTATPQAFATPAVQAAAVAGDWSPTTSSATVMEPPERYANWDDFQLNSPAVQRAWTDLATQALPDMRQAPLALSAVMSARHPEVGSPIASLTAPGENRWALHAASIVLVLSGICVPLFTALLLPRPAAGSMSPATRMTIGLCWSVVAITAAYWLTLKRVPQWTVTCGVFDNGLLWEQGDTIDACPWEQIQDVRVGHETGALVARVQLRPNRRAIFSAAGRPTDMPILEFLVAKATAARFMADLRRLYDGETLRYGVVTLDRAGFAARGFRIPWASIVRVVTDASRLFVVCRDRVDWHGIPSRQVAFPNLVLSLAHIMIADSHRLPKRTE